MQNKNIFTKQVAGITVGVFLLLACIVFALVLGGGQEKNESLQMSWESIPETVAGENPTQQDESAQINDNEESAETEPEQEASNQEDDREYYFVLTKVLPVYASDSISENAKATPVERLSRGDRIEWLHEGLTENQYCKIKTPAGTEGYVWFDCVASMTQAQFDERKDKVIVIDPGHQGKQNTEKEPIGPGASETKAKVSSGTRGVSTEIPENQLTLDISMKLEKALEEQGYIAVILRRSAEINISNMERAMIANAVEADVFIRIHADGSANPEANGAMTIISTGKNKYDVVKYYNESRKLAEYVLEEYTGASGIKANRIMESDIYSGINWCTVPVTILEMGFMTNPEEDRKMQDEEMQDKMVEGIVSGISKYLSDI